MKKVLITGGYGFLGNEIFQKINKNENFEVYRFRSSEFDLTKSIQAELLFKQIQPNYVIHAAARLGGIGDNQKSPASYFKTNMKIGLNVLELSAIHKIDKLINIGTVCSYPKYSPTPFKEENLWNGFPEKTNSAYGISKRALFSYSEALNQQYDLQSTNLLLANLYGPGDDFRVGTSHVIPALIRKIDDAINQSKDFIEVWGDGSPTRDFLYVSDAANIICNFLNTNKEKPQEPINVGTGTETSIKYLIELISELMGFNGDIIYDPNKPNGQPQRVLNIERLIEIQGILNFTELKEGLKETIRFYSKNKESIRTQKSKF